MWHVDEGTLHAYLDDRDRGEAAGALEAGLRARVTAHLAECDVCSAQLQLAERQRARAADILLAASPAIENPPFEAMQPLATAARPRPAPLPASPRTAPRRAWVPMAWAASIVLAVGAGWMASMISRGSESPGARDQPAASRSVGDAGSADFAGRAPQPAGSAAAAPAASTLEATDREAQTAAAPSRKEEGGVLPNVPSPAAQRLQAARLDAAAAEPVVAAEQKTAVTEQKAAVTEQTAAGTEQKAAVGGRVADAAAWNRITVTGADVRARDTTALGGVARVAAPAAGAPRRQLLATEQAPGFARSAESGYPGDADVAWMTVTREDAERLLGAPLYLVTGAPIAEIAVAPQAMPVLVRVRQRTDEGQLELLQWPAAEAQKLAVGAQQGLADMARAVRPQAQAERAVAPTSPTPPPAASPTLTVGRASDGWSVVTVPATAHPVLLKIPPAVDPIPLLGRIRQVR